MFISLPKFKLIKEAFLFNLHKSNFSKKTIMFKKLFTTTMALCFTLLSAKADEGMWLPLLLQDNEADMQNLGLQLTAEDIYNINNSSLKDAVVSLGGFCTAEMISDQGLLLTNHHCGYGQIQSHSTVSNDYLTDGFWAMDRSEELENEDLFVSFLVRMENVTERMNTALDSVSDEERSGIIRKLSAEIVAEATDSTHYNARVKPFLEAMTSISWCTKLLTMCVW